jgi:regulatory factor X 1/2/3
MSHTVAAQRVQPTYLKNEYAEGTADQTIDADSHTLQPMDKVRETRAMSFSVCQQKYYRNNSVFTYSQMKSNSTQRTSACHLFAQDTGAYFIQQDVDPDAVHTHTATRTASLQRVTADVGGVAYVGPGNTTTKPSSLDGGGYPNLSLATSTSMSPVEWLLQNFEFAQDMSLPRSTMYNLYLRYCNENKLKPLTAALLGKVINNVFVCLRTRRIGKRGNNEYHYYGIRVIPGSAVSQLAEDENLTVCQKPAQKHCKFLPCSGGTLKVENEYEQNTNNSIACHHSNSLPKDPHQHLHLGDVKGRIPDFPYIEYPPVFHPPGYCTLEDLDTFCRIYREHCAAVLDAVVNLKFQTVESLWREFWRSQDESNGDKCDEKYLSKTKLYLLCKWGPVQQFVRRVDCVYHQIVVDALIPDVLMPIPISVIQAIRNFADELESCLKRAMTKCPEEMLHIKVSAVSALAQKLRRYSSLNHLAEAARPVLQNSSMTYQMLVDLDQVDFRNIQDQASWICQCGDSMAQLEIDFKNMLYEQNSLEQWAAWLKGVVSQVLKPYEGKPNFAKAARQFLLKWSFCTSLVIRDLTLRRAASFGYFQAIRLFYDEYMIFIIEHKVALETGDSIAVIGEKFNSNPSNVSNFIQPGPSNEGFSLTVGVPVNVGRKMAPTTLDVGSNEASHHVVATKRLKIG